MTTIPQTREAALDMLADMDARKWGESERAASKALNARKSYGLLLNTIAHRPEHNYGDSAPELVAAAKVALTPEDWAELRKGG